MRTNIPTKGRLEEFFVCVRADVTGKRSIMTSPLAGGSPELVQRLEKAGDVLWDIDCPDRAGASCVLGEQWANEATFYALDLAKGRGSELASLSTGVGNLHWSLSADGSTIAVAGLVDRGNGIALIDLGDGRHRDLVVPEATFLRYIDWDPSGMPSSSRVGFRTAGGGCCGQV